MNIVPLVEGVAGNIISPWLANYLLEGYFSPTVCTIIGSSLFQCFVSKSRSYVSITASIVGTASLSQLVNQLFGNYLHPLVCSIMAGSLYQYGVSKLMGRGATSEPNHDQLLDHFIGILNQEKGDDARRCVEVLKSLKGKPASVVEQNEVFKALVSHFVQQSQTLPDRPTSEPLELREQKSVQNAVKEVQKRFPNRATRAELNGFLTGTFLPQYHSAIISALPKNFCS